MPKVQKFLANESGIQEKVGFQARSLRHLPLRKCSPLSGRGRIFSLFSRVMREGLSTGSRRQCVRPRKRSLGADILRPHDCAILVNFS